MFKNPVKKGLILQISTLDSGVATALGQLPTASQDLLNEFGAVFEVPIGLPPIRGHEHGITLKEGAQPVYERPYKYPYYQKLEIEKNCEGIIRSRLN